MAEEEGKEIKDPRAEGLRIARNYLSRMGWTREWRRYTTTQISARFNRDELEDKNRRADAMEEDAEAELSAEFERLRHSADPMAKEVLAVVYQTRSPRHDLGLIGKSIVNRIRDMLRPY